MQAQQRSFVPFLPALAALGLLVGCDAATGAGASLAIEPDSIDFGYVEPLAFSGAREVRMTNLAGNGNVLVQSLRISGSGADAFIITEQPASFPEGVQSGVTLAVKVSFTPPGSGTYNANVEIVTDADADPILVPLGGCSTGPDCVVQVGDDDDAVGDDDDGVGDDDDGVGDDDDGAGLGQISVSPAAADLGTVAQNQTPINDVITLTNVGSGPLTIDSIGMADGTWFTVQGYSSGTLQAGSAPVNLQISFDPSGAPVGPLQDSILIESNSATDPTLSVPVSVVVDQSCPPPCSGDLLVHGAQELSIFGLITVNYVEVTEASPVVTVENVGQGPLSLLPVTEGGQYCADNPAAAYITGAPSQLGPGETADLEFSIGPDTIEVVNFAGTYAFSVGTVAGNATDVGDWGTANCSLL